MGLVRFKESAALRHLSLSRRPIGEESIVAIAAFQRLEILSRKKLVTSLPIGAKIEW